MNLKNLRILCFAIILFSTSCTSYKTVPYFQDISRTDVTTQKIENYTPPAIQPNDLLAIHVTSMNREADAQINYNLERPNGNTVASLDRPEENAVTGYLVDKEGNIDIPYLGTIKVAGISTFDLKYKLVEGLSKYLSSPVVTVRIQNFKVSVLGDVKNPGTFYSMNERITVAEAISLAGDLNTTGVRNVLLVREADGQRQTINLDLTSKSTLTSPYFYLRNNDVIYVTPNKERVVATDSSLQKASLIISALSVLAILITRL